MKALALAPAAEADIDQIWDYTAVKWGADQADTYTDDIRNTCMRLASGLPKGGSLMFARAT